MYDLLLSDDEAMIAGSVRDFLEAELPLARLRPDAKLLDAGAVWRGMAGLGWLGVALPEQAGGSGLGIVEEALIQRECGRYLVSPGVLATMLAGHVALHAGDAGLAAAFAAGDAAAALIIDAAPAVMDRERDVLAIDRKPDAWLLYWNDDGMGLFEPSCLREATEGDPFDDSVTVQSGKLILDSATFWVAAEREPLPLRADVLLAAALVGLASHACDLAVDYAGLREQFGKPIGSFQAVKHRCADMAVRQRLAWYQTCLAALKLQAGADDAQLQVASAKVLAAEAAHENGRAAIQIHGGIGFQAECDVHWFVKRAVLYDQAGGAMARQCERIIAAPRPAW